MIDPRAHRLGNLVEYNPKEMDIESDDIVWAIGAIEPGGVMLDDPFDEWYAPNELNPVALTPEWLTRMGFHEGDGVWIRDKVSVIMDKIDGKTMGVVIGDFKRISYVHELQNIYFEKTGEELCFDFKVCQHGSLSPRQEP